MCCDKGKFYDTQESMNCDSCPQTDICKIYCVFWFLIPWLLLARTVQRVRMHVQHVSQDTSAAVALVTYILQLLLGTDGSIAYELWAITAEPCVQWAIST